MPNSPDPRDGEQARLDAARDRLLGTVCFCGALAGLMRGKLEGKIGQRVTIEQDCAPLRCLAHGYCLAHSTPVDVQMSPVDKAYIAKRCGFDLNTVNL